MLTEEDPKQHGPRDHRRAKALHGAIAAPGAGPAGQAPQGDASGHDSQGGYDPELYDGSTTEAVSHERLLAKIL